MQPPTDFSTRLNMILHPYLRWWRLVEQYLSNRFNQAEPPTGSLSFGSKWIERSLSFPVICRFTLYMPVLYKLAIEGGRRVRPSAPWLGEFTLDTSHMETTLSLAHNEQQTFMHTLDTPCGFQHRVWSRWGARAHVEPSDPFTSGAGTEIPQFNGGKDQRQNMCRSYWQMTLHFLWNLRSLRISRLQFDGNWSVFWQFFKESAISGKSEITTLGICFLHFSSAKPAAMTAVPEQGQIAGASCGADAQWGWYFTAMW